MVDISRLSRLVTGIQRQVDLQQNALVVGSLKVGSTSPVELTKTILTNLIALQNGSDFSDGTNAHTHDGRYRTETELASTSTGQGASFIGIEDAGAYYAGSTVEAALTELKNQIGGATSSTYNFTEANVLADNDALYAALQKLDLKWGDLASTAAGEGAALVGIEDAGTYYAGATVEAALQEVGQDAAQLRTLSGTADGATHLGTFTGTTIADSSTIKSALQSLETYGEQTRSLVQNFEWQESAISIELDSANIVGPSTGDRYLIAGTGLNDFAGQDNKIAEWDGAAWVFTAPSVGMYIAVDDESDGLYVYGGSSWSKKYFEATTASTGLTKVGFDIRLDSSAAGDGLGFSSGVLSVNVDGATLELNTDALRVKADGINDTHIRLLNQGWLTARNAANSGDINVLKVNASDEVEFALLPRLTADVTPTLDTHFATKKYVDDVAAAQDDASEITYTPGVLANWTGSADPGEVDDALDQLADRVTDLEAGATALTETLVAGETLAAGVKAVRYAIAAASETAGRVYLADPTELSVSSKDPFHVIGLLVATGETAGTNVVIYKAGVMTATAHGFAVGEPIYLDSTGALTATPPSTAGEACVKVGMAKTANAIEVQIQVMGVN